MKALTDLLTPIITPDWGALVGLIPVFLAIVVILWFGLTIRRFATAGPTRRAPARIDPIPPPTIHMPGGSIAPFLVAVGAASLFLGLVVGGPALIGGVVVLVATLILWGREAVRDYDHLEPVPALPAVVHEPPPGLHMPGPSIRPFMGALGTAALFGGLVAGGLMLVVAVLFLAWTLIGWLIDFRAEYSKTVEADRTRHLENIPSRGLPIRSLQAFGVLFVLAALIQAGILPPQGGASAGGPGGSPGPSAAAGASLAPGTLAVTAKDIAFDTHALTATANKPFTIDFKNQDQAGVMHNIEIKKSDGTVVTDPPTIDGGAETSYAYPALPQGTYTFICKVHQIASMTGTLTVK